MTKPPTMQHNKSTQDIISKKYILTIEIQFNNELYVIKETSNVGAGANVEVWSSRSIEGIILRKEGSFFNRGSCKVTKDGGHLFFGIRQSDSGLWKEYHSEAFKDDLAF